MEKLWSLSDEEQALVIEHRRQLLAERNRLARRLRVLELALKYEHWLQKNERGSSFSTFVNEFGCDDGNSNTLYEQVQGVRDLL